MSYRQISSTLVAVTSFTDARLVHLPLYDTLWGWVDAHGWRIPAWVETEIFTALYGH